MYENYYYPDYLAHYGVKGMRWGVRNAKYYDSRVEANTRRADKALTKKGKARALNRAEVNKYYADRARRYEKADTLKDRLLVDYGNDDAVKAMKAYTNMEKNNAKAARTKLGRQIHKVNAMNNEEGTKVREGMRDAKGLKNKGKAAITGMANMKVTSLAGRTRTYGEAIVEELVPGLGLMRDIGYYADHRKDFGKVS